MRILWLALLALLLLPAQIRLRGCDVVTDDNPADDGATGSAAVCDPDVGEPDRMVCRVRSGAGGCPEPSDNGDWTLHSVFGRGALVPPPAALNRTCLYRTDLATPDWNTSGLASHADLSCACDRAVVAPLQASWEATVGRAYAAEFPSHAGALGAVPAANQPVEVRLAILDEFSGEPGPYPDPATHGGAVHAIAHTLLCPEEGGPCLAEIVDQPLLYHGDDDEGALPGPSSTFVELSQAIYAVVEDWERGATLLSPPRYLVINLSLGWHPGHGGISSFDLDGLHGSEKSVDPVATRPSAVIDDPAVESVYRALRYAQCHGALVFAAAGNATRAGDEGPVLPAAWGADSYRPRTLLAQTGIAGGEVDDLRDCASFFDTNVPDAEILDYRDVSPLLVPIGAVDADGYELALARAGSRPQLMAYGDHVTVEIREAGPAPLPGSMPLTSVPLTGTSAATPIVAATAAMLLALERPPAERPLYDLMRQIYDGTSHTVPGGEVSAWFRETPYGAYPDARWVRPCEVLEPHAGPCPDAQERVGFPEDTAAEFDFAEPPLCLSQLVYVVGGDPDQQHGNLGPVYTIASGIAGGICPEQELADSGVTPHLDEHHDSVLERPAVYGQPPTTRCPYCYMRVDVATNAGVLNLNFTNTDTGILRDGELQLFQRGIDGRIARLATINLGDLDTGIPSTVTLRAVRLDWSKVVQARLVGVEQVGTQTAAYVTSVRVVR